jgi:hypothetical protein
MAGLMTASGVAAGTAGSNSLDRMLAKTAKSRSSSKKQLARLLWNPTTQGTYVTTEGKKRMKDRQDRYENGSSLPEKLSARQQRNRRKLQKRQLREFNALADANMQAIAAKYPGSSTNG